MYSIRPFFDKFHRFQKETPPYARVVPHFQSKINIPGSLFCNNHTTMIVVGRQKYKNRHMFDTFHSQTKQFFLKGNDIFSSLRKIIPQPSRSFLVYA